MSKQHFFKNFRSEERFQNVVALSSFPLLTCGGMAYLRRVLLSLNITITVFLSKSVERKTALKYCDQKKAV